MGRRIHLERLLLGRSAFEELELSDEEGEGQVEGAEEARGESQQNAENDDQHRQQYDHKGRPTNSATENIRKQQRHAQNAILELVGVVERKERGASEMYEKICKARDALLRREHEEGDGLELLVIAIGRGFTWFSQTLMARIQAGIYSFSLPFAEIVSYALQQAGSGSWRNTFATMFPGFTALALCATIEMVLYDGAYHLISLEETPIMERAGTRNQPRDIDTAVTAIRIAREVAFTAIDIALLPLKYHGYAQMLGIAPFYPLLPPAWPFPLNTTLPSYHTFIWTPLLPHGPLRAVSSPALLLLALNYLTRPTGDPTTPPTATHLTTYEYQAVNRGPSPSRPPCPTDPLNPYFAAAAHIRDSLMTYLGYNLRARRLYLPHDDAPGPLSLTSDSSPDLHRNAIYPPTPETSTRYHLHRSTSLALIPPQYLAERIDRLFTSVLTLGLESTVLRAITSSYLSVPELPKTMLAFSAVRKYYVTTGLGRAKLAPFGAWAFGLRYVNKLALSIAFCCAAETAAVLAVCGAVRWYGRQFYGWGDPEEEAWPREIGGVEYWRVVDE